jgi:osmoprotectant transport system permease protein
MKRLNKLIMLLLVCVLISVSFGCSPKEPDIIIGTKDFTEQYILGHILLQYIEANTNLTAVYKNDLLSDVIFASIRTGVVDLYVDYTGTVYGSHFKYTDTKDPYEVHSITARELRDRYDLIMLAPLGFNNTFGLAVKLETAEAHNLKTISDLAGVSQDFIFGCNPQMLTRFDGLPNLKKLYGISFKEEVMTDLLDRYTAIAEDRLHVVEVYSTDGKLLEYGLYVLEDDKQFFPPYEGAIIIRADTAERFPELIDILNVLNGVITNEIIINLNYKVDVLGETPKAAAEYFLRMQGLIE